MFGKFSGKGHEELMAEFAGILRGGGVPEAAAKALEEDGAVSERMYAAARAVGHAVPEAGIEEKLVESHRPGREGLMNDVERADRVLREAVVGHFAPCVEAIVDASLQRDGSTTGAEALEDAAGIRRAVIEAVVERLERREA